MNPAHAREDSSSGWPYRPSAGFFDEMLADDGQLRSHWRTLIESVAAMGAGFIG